MSLQEWLVLVSIAVVGGVLVNVLYKIMGVWPHGREEWIGFYDQREVKGAVALALLAMYFFCSPEVLSRIEIAVCLSLILVGGVFLLGLWSLFSFLPLKAMVLMIISLGTAPIILKALATENFRYIYRILGFYTVAVIFLLFAEGCRHWLKDRQRLRPIDLTTQQLKNSLSRMRLSWKKVEVTIHNEEVESVTYVEEDAMVISKDKWEDLIEVYPELERLLPHYDHENKNLKYIVIRNNSEHYDSEWYDKIQRPICTHDLVNSGENFEIKLI